MTIITMRRLLSLIIWMASLIGFSILYNQAEMYAEGGGGEKMYYISYVLLGICIIAFFCLLYFSGLFRKKK